ncbi:MAG: VOC family protein [Microthrixaceae bacterium]
MNVSLEAPYHVGIVVPDLDVAMASYSEVLDVDWASVQDLTVDLCDQGGCTTTPVRITYSCAGPTYLELIEAVPGTVWTASDEVHHVGVWTGDVDARSRELDALGYPAVAWAAGREGGRAWFAYHRVPNLGLVELVDQRSQPAFERWVAGGEYR